MSRQLSQLGQPEICCGYSKRLTLIASMIDREPSFSILSAILRLRRPIFGSLHLSSNGVTIIRTYRPLKADSPTICGMTARVRSESSLAYCRGFLRGLRAQFYIRDFVSTSSCQNKSRQNSRCQDAQSENTLLVITARTKNPFEVMQQPETPSAPDPNQRRKFQRHRTTERSESSRR